MGVHAGSVLVGDHIRNFGDVVETLVVGEKVRLTSDAGTDWYVPAEHVVDVAYFNGAIRRHENMKGGIDHGCHV